MRNRIKRSHAALGRLRTTGLKGIAGHKEACFSLRELPRGGGCGGWGVGMDPPTYLMVASEVKDKSLLAVL